MKFVQVMRYLKWSSSQTFHIGPRSFVRCLQTKTVMPISPILETSSFRTYQEMAYFHLIEKDYWKSVVKKLLDPQNESNIQVIHNYFSKNILDDNSKSSVSVAQSNLPSYIATMKKHYVSDQIVAMCDSRCSEIFDLHFSPIRVSSFEYIHAWLHHFHPHFISVQQLTCFGKLLQFRCREILQSQDESDLPDKLVHLAFLAAMGKKSFDSHEILNQLATFCDKNNASTYQALSKNPFDLAIICECFFKGGIRIEDKKSLSSIATTLCSFLHQTLHSQDQHFNPFVIISLLKVLRQVNFIDGELLGLLSELILHPLCGEKVRDIRFIINVAGAFSFPGCQKLHPTTSSGDDLSIEKILGRVDNLVLGILAEEEKATTARKSPQNGEKDAQMSSESGIVVKSRLKDISKFLWISASLGYQIPSPKTYIKDLATRLDKGQFSKKPDEGIDSLLSLAIMNQYPDSSQVSKILQSTDFRSSVKVNASNRHKGRLGLFLTSLRMERASLWNHLSSEEEAQWFEAVRTPFSITESNAWSQSHRKVKPLRVPAGIRNDFKPHTQLLNACMDAVIEIFSQNQAPATVSTAEMLKLKIKQKEDFNKISTATTSTSPSNNATNKKTSSAKLIALLLDSKCDRDVPYQNQRAQVYVGYSVPFLFIPGLKIVFPSTRKEIYLEVLDDVGLSSSYHGYKMRLMEKMQYSYTKVTRDEIQDVDNSKLKKILLSRIKDIS